MIIASICNCSPLPHVLSLYQKLVNASFKMIKTILKYISISIYVMLPLCVQGQIMYPGDATNNGEVNGIDALYLGIAYGITGAPRDNAETDWTPQDITELWGYFFF